ncbi:unnamed protein product [Pedinophyceae sp. YPF-701]|nr:unnamed protein product [Pedinophyceae sp. YPF-701]
MALEQYPYTLAVEGDARPCQTDPGTWLKESPSGAYTTARTVDQNMVLELDFHITRLATSARLMLAEQLGVAPEAVPAAVNAGAEDAPAPDDRLSQFQCLTDEAELGPRVRKSLRAAVKSFLSTREFYGGELKLTVLVTWDLAAGPNSVRVQSHVAPMGSRPAPPVKIEVMGAPRQNALAKDSEWVKQRTSLEAAKAKDTQEVVLAHPDGNGDLELLEGLSSNFFAVMDGKVVTADEGILPGTVRAVLLEACKRENIPVELRPPLLSEAPRWEGALIASTSRFALPVHEVVVPASTRGDAGGEAQRWTFEPVGTLAGRLDALVLQLVREMSQTL